MKNKYIFCHSCEDYQECRYIGHQKLEGTALDNYLFKIYECLNCQNSKVEVENKLEKKIMKGPENE